MRLLAALAVLALLAIAPAWAQAAVRTVIPVTAVALPGGAMRYSVPVRIGDGPVVEAMLDTGSVGLRFMPGAIDPSFYNPTGRSMQARFGSGVQLSGKLARAQVTVGDLAIDTTVIQVAETATCLPGRDGCPASRSVGDFRINGRFAAILGIGLRPNPADNPLRLTGDRAWILILPRPGESQPGQLIVNPTPEERAGFTLFKLPPRSAPVGDGWADTDLPACLAWTGAAPVCGPALLDSGTPSLTLGGPDGPVNWQPGEEATLTFGEPAPGVSLTFRFGQGPGARMRRRPPGPIGEQYLLNTGVLPYYSFAVLYDARAGTIGLKPRG